MKFTIALSTLLLVATSSVSALGINCRGNSNCGGTLCQLTDLLAQANRLPDGNIYFPGQHIVCCGDNAIASGLCAFTQSTSENITGARVKELLQGLVNHGCGKCGSNPFQNNDVSQGQLTVNWVSQR
ncbi:killer toxin [Coprinopsis marcescibilis]|uniref:Killer toxin n=1 Tax=Coprinopsis marcescibilis TaxID=230819 RepID=A0A5C3L3W5_COPMA|nr:killer toxin [Coprinopsis marcescibilis]